MFIHDIGLCVWTLARFLVDVRLPSRRLLIIIALWAPSPLFVAYEIPRAYVFPPFLPARP
ncbi:hypothetical protein DPMN_175490 [Dreissena polymorpha]|uniref:Uncharacterized protein n=1 Tax=Dreissena polymorpha TaxID=45954 RepID=A0A9D4E5A8_DREPO|nr:hypothetical protein DPMN_175490 [Dreissena polymorpha]